MDKNKNILIADIYSKCSTGYYSIIDEDEVKEILKGDKADLDERRF